MCKESKHYDKNHSTNVSGTCIDGIKNGDEVDVDCGGDCPACGKLLFYNISLHGIFLDFPMIFH